MHPENLETAKQHLERYTNGVSESIDLLIRFKHLDGSIVWMHGRGGVFSDAPFRKRKQARSGFECNVGPDLSRYFMHGCKVGFKRLARCP